MKRKKKNLSTRNLYNIIRNSYILDFVWKTETRGPDGEGSNIWRSLMDLQEVSIQDILLLLLY